MDIDDLQVLPWLGIRLYTNLDFGSFAQSSDGGLHLYIKEGRDGAADLGPQIKLGISPKFNVIEDHAPNAGNSLAPFNGVSFPSQAGSRASGHVCEMDGDPAVEPELDAFGLILPLPYRVAITLVLGTQRYPFAARRP
jgi:hypothetical protein